MFLQPNPKNYHAQYPNINRHWSPKSEDFAGGDSLLTALSRGWKVGHTVVREEHWHAGVRLVCVYRFTLRKGDIEINMPVIGNPYVMRMLYMEPFEIIGEDATEASEQKIS
ncbi:MAG: hypothetical protein AAFU54_09170 [Chloroflexota bacterium]